jgi:uncharacterized membrane protein YfcA
MNNLFELLSRVKERFDDPKTILFVLLSLVTVWFIAGWAMRMKTEADSAYHTVVAFVATFFDTLGIGNFAPTTSAFKFRSSVPDEKIPGTLNVGYAIPTIAQALIYIAIVNVDFKTLASMIGASVLGAWLGAGFVARWPRRRIQIGMGSALLAAATLMVLKQFDIGPGGGEATSLEDKRLAIGLAGNLGLGVLMTMGIGLYGPCLILVSLLGMDPRAAFPIMMGSCAFLMPIGGLRFIREGSYDLRAALLMTAFGTPAVLIAAYLVKEMPLEYVRWLVIVAATYAAVMMLRSASIERANTE